MLDSAGSATVLGSVKEWVLAMLAAKRRLRVAPVPAYSRP